MSRARIERKGKIVGSSRPCWSVSENHLAWIIFTVVGLFCGKHHCCLLVQPKLLATCEFPFNGSIYSQLLSARELQVDQSGEEWGSKRSCCTLKLNAPLVPAGELQQWNPPFAGARGWGSIIHCQVFIPVLGNDIEGCTLRGSRSSTSHTDRPERNWIKICLLRKEDNIKWKM